MEAVNHPDDPAAGTRPLPFWRELYIEQDDFMEDPPKKFFRLAPGREVRLRYAYFITCTEVVKNAAGEVVELRCTYDPATKGGNAPDGRKVKATIHWLSAAQSMPAEIRLYNQLFLNPAPDAANFTGDLNPHSLEILSDARIEPAIATPIRPRRCSSSGRAISCGMPIDAGSGRCSIGPSACAIRLPRKSAVKTKAVLGASKPWLMAPLSLCRGRCLPTQLFGRFRMFPVIVALAGFCGTIEPFLHCRRPQAFVPGVDDGLVADIGQI